MGGGFWGKLKIMQDIYIFKNLPAWCKYQNDKWNCFQKIPANQIKWNIKKISCKQNNFPALPPSPHPVPIANDANTEAVLPVINGA